MSGPLHGVSVVELAGLGPAPFCGMVLADLGAEVIRVDRQGDNTMSFLPGPEHDVHSRGKRSIAIDLKSEVGVEVVLRLVRRSDILIEGYRPGVTERLGLGPGRCLAENPALVYGRMTGWGQEGPYATTAGHDIDYIAVSGVLHAIGTQEAPIVPLNLLGDFGGGGMLLVVGVLAALFAARSGGVGQVVDAAMVDGSAVLASSIHGMLDAGLWDDRRESNFLDGGAPFYAVYATSDGRHMAVGALEPQFFASLVDHLGVDVPPQLDREGWPEMRATFGRAFATRTQQEWSEAFAGSDACVFPVRSLTEARLDPHLQSRETFIDVGGVTQPAPAPRFSATPTGPPKPPVERGSDTDDVLEALGYSEGEIIKLRGDGVVG
ncbi:MAG: CaiB/BaiF CoA-transferase family protein [Acidimicrobiia bacterium]